MKPSTLTAVALITIAALATLLYAPYFGNALVFDDHNLFTNLAVFDFAQTPVDGHARTFPYFTLGLIHVLTDSIPANRAVSLLLHIAVGSVLYLLCLRWLSAAGIQDAVRARLAALAATLFFVLNPVAVYGAGYLIQRTILFATLFSLLSLLFVLRGATERRPADLITAALFYAAAVFSKEHAVLLPVGAIALLWAVRPNRRDALRQVALYSLLCLPAAVAVILAKQTLVGSSYEIYAPVVTTQLDVSAGRNWWLVSALTQTRMFFAYVFRWLAPAPGWLSADLRPEIFADPLDPLNLLGVLGFATLGVGAITLLLSNTTSVRMAGAALCGLLGHFAVEFSAVRVQEPLVLYRSYLWAPGLAMLLAYPLAQRSLRNATAALLTLLILMFPARERLDSLATETAVWNDAAAKLPREDIPGADRIYYNRGNDALKEKNFAAALADFERVVELNPKGFQGHIGRARARLADNSAAHMALADIDRALQLNENPTFVPAILFLRCSALSALQRQDEADRCVDVAAALGHPMARMMRLPK